jgi:hypothetical protein
MILLGMLCSATAFPLTSHIADVQHHPDHRLRMYRAIGEWIESNTEIDASIGALEVGIIGYYSGRKMIDFAGLIQPSIAEQLAPTTSYQDAASWAIKTYRPDYLILPTAWAGEFSDGAELAACHNIKRFFGDPYGYRGDLIVYHCD